MEGVGVRTLVDAAVDACGGPGPIERYGLVAVDGATIAATGVRGVAQAEIDAGRVCRTSRELALGDGDLRLLVLVQFAADGQAQDLWVVDGWRLVASRGEGLDLRGARLRGAQLRGARLKQADLAEADLSGADLAKADLSLADLTGADLSGSTLHRGSLFRANLTEAELCRADLRHADLRETVCDRAAFRGADLWDACFWDVDLSKAFVEGAGVERAYQPR